MRKFLLFAIFAMACYITLSAQLRVDSIGNVKVFNHLGVGVEPENNSSVSLFKELSTTGSYFGIKSTLNAAYGTLFDRQYISVCGIVETDTVNNNAPSPTSLDGSKLPRGKFKVGLLGIANQGVGVYGTNNLTIPTILSGNYAGYFNGNTKVVGTLTATTVTTTSDYRLKQNIAELTNANNLLLQLTPISYRFKDDANRLYPKGSQELTNTHYGLVAQEVQKILPNIVYEGQDGYLSINYTELVPLLIQSVKELKAENEKQNEIIESLQTLINKQSNSPSKVQGKSENPDEINAKLYQNQPNPFSQATDIKYSLPLETQSATLYIYDMSGVQLRSYPITQFGENSLTINANDLVAGMYLYSLIADGQVVDTKRMILTK